MKALEKEKKPSARWPEVVVRHPPGLAEAVAHFLFEAGATALLQDESPEAPGLWFSLAGFKPGLSRANLAAHLDKFLADLSDIFELASRPRAEWRTVSEGDWAEKWKLGLTPLEIGPFLVIKPSWCEYEARPGQRVVELDPGLAFGSGRHPSTFMCLKMLDEFYDRASWPRRRVLDVGAGSGILALACAALGSSSITAIDKDPEVLPVAARNLAANRAAGRVHLACADPAGLKAEFDLIMANLTSEELVRLCPHLSRLAAPGAILILSGILRSQAKDVAGCYADRDFHTIRRLKDGEWAALAMSREGRA